MFAFPAAKRTIVLLMSIALIVSAAAATADDEKGYLGVTLQDITPSMAKALQMDEKTGVMVNEVVDDSPAEKAGFEDGDVILEFNGKTISDDKDLTKAVRGTNPGDEVKVVVLREGKKKTLDVEVGTYEDKNVFVIAEDGDFYAPHIEHFKKDGNHVIVMSGDDEDFTWTTKDNMVMKFDTDRGYMGVHLDSINEQMGEYFGVEDGKGALVTEVVEDSPAAAAGFKAGDVIVRFGENEIDSPEALHKAIADTEPEQQLAVEVVRKDQSKSLSITLGEMPEDAISKRIKVIGENDDHWTIHTAPSMLQYHKQHGNHGDVDVRVIRRAPHAEDFEWHELHEVEEASEELEEMREELEEMKKELQEMKKELEK